MTVEEILKQNGYTDEQIKEADPKLMTAIAAVLSTATSAQSAAEARINEAQDIERRYNHMYHSEIVPALNKWGSDKANQDAENARLQAELTFYKTQNEGARSAGFVPNEAPRFTPDPNVKPAESRGPDGRYVTQGNPVPGSPALLSELMRGMSEMSWAENTYRRLYGEDLPETYDFYKEVEEGNRNAMSFRDHFSRKYKFEEKLKSINEQKQQKHDEAIRKEERSKLEKEWAERGGTNPNVRQAASSQYARVKKAVETGEAKDPLMMGAEARRAQTSRMIKAEIAERESQGNA
ncbi:MAG: hypothetical protein C5B54_02460 [Acidobacteria bacterium]|nr:MAG: hypothetical protein C5B54_02460 [Acidobacteriota bacterium]